MNLGMVLRGWRFHEEMSSDEVADAIGISRPTYTKIEQGLRPAQGTLDTVMAWLLSDSGLSPRARSQQQVE